MSGSIEQVPSDGKLTVLAREIQQEVEAAETAWSKALQHAIRADELLIEAKGMVKRGEWEPWLKANSPGGRTTAANYMRLARNRQQVADLPGVREAVAYLAAPKKKVIGSNRRVSGYFIDVEDLEPVPVSRGQLVLDDTGEPPLGALAGKPRDAAVRAKLEAMPSKELYTLEVAGEIATTLLESRRTPNEGEKRVLARAAVLLEEDSEGEEDS